MNYEELANKLINNTNNYYSVHIICADPRDSIDQIRKYITDYSILTKNNIKELIFKNNARVKSSGNSASCMCATKGLTINELYVIGELQEHLLEELMATVYPVIKSGKGEIYFISEINSK